MLGLRRRLCWQCEHTAAFQRGRTTPAGPPSQQRPLTRLTDNGRGELTGRRWARAELCVGAGGRCCPSLSASRVAEIQAGPLWGGEGERVHLCPRPPPLNRSLSPSHAHSSTSTSRASHHSLVRSTRLLRFQLSHTTPAFVASRRSLVLRSSWVRVLVRARGRAPARARGRVRGRAATEDSAAAASTAGASAEALSTTEVTTPHSAPHTAHAASECATDSHRSLH